MTAQCCQQHQVSHDVTRTMSRCRDISRGSETAQTPSLRHRSTLSIHTQVIVSWCLMSLFSTNIWLYQGQKVRGRVYPYPV